MMKKTPVKILETMLDRHCPNVQVVAQADGVRSGLKTIEKHRPDVVLLDIQMKDGTGFDLLKKVGPIDFKIIFITAYQEYAIEAFKFSAADYILKPINPDHIIEAIQKVEENIDLDSMKMKVNALIANMDQISKQDKKIVLKTQESIYLVDVPDIIRCESDGNYTKFFLIDGRQLLVSRLIKEYEEMLQRYKFIRVHQSHLINLKYFVEFQKKNDLIKMKDDSIIPVASRKKDQLFKVIESI